MCVLIVWLFGILPLQKKETCESELSIRRHVVKLYQKITAIYMKSMLLNDQFYKEKNTNTYESFMI